MYRLLKTVFLLCFLLLSINQSAYTQENFFFNKLERFSETTILSNNNINCLMQDTTGFLWIGTSYGLNKYDGSKIKKYYYSVDDPNSIGDNDIQKIFLDSDGNLWVLVPQYFCMYDEEQDCFIRFKYADEKKNTHTSNAGGIAEDEKGHIWIGTPEMGLYSLDKASGNITTHFYPQETISCLQYDGNGKIWVGSGGQLFIYETKQYSFVTVNLPVFEPVVKIDFLHHQVFTRNHAYQYSPEDATQIPVNPSGELFSLPVTNIYDVIECDNQYWIGSKGDGLAVYDKKNDTSFISRYKRNDPHTISNNTVKTIFRDRSGVIWIGTNDGLNKFNPYRNHFIHLHQEEGLISNILTSINEDKDHYIWFTTYDGVSRMDPTTGKFLNFSAVNVEGVDMDFRNIRDVSNDLSGNLWFSHREGVYKYEREKNKFHFFPLSYKEFQGSDVLCTYGGKDIYVWAGTYGNGVFQLDCKSDKILNAFNTTNSDISSDYIKDIIALENSSLCFATLRTGIDIYEPQANSFINIRFSDLTQNYVSDYINNVYQDSRGLLWVLSWYGAFVMDENYKLIYQFTTNEGIITNELTAVTEDYNGDIWLGSVNGVSRISFFSENHYLISQYTVEDGLSANNICTGGAFTASDHTLYIGGSNGINSFRIKDVPIRFISIPPIINGLHIFNKQVNPGENVNGQIVLNRQVNLLSDLHLNYKQKSISLDFTSLDFSQNKKVRYAYRLDGIDKEWVYTDNQINSASYNNLYPGHYKFRVKSANTGGIWSEETLLNIHISPPFWATWWAYTLYLILFLAIMWLITHVLLIQERLKQNLRIEKIQHEKENEINNIKLRFYTNISHDIRTPLTLIVGPLEHILRNEKFTDELQNKITLVRDNASYLLHLVNQLLDFRKMETGHSLLKASRHNIVFFVQRITSAFEPYAKQREITLSFRIDIPEEYIWFDPQLLSKVFYNLLSNALKFTQKGDSVIVSISNTEKEVCIRIADTGIGIDPEEQSKIFEDFYQINSNNSSLLNTYTSGSGIGLTIVKKYVELHKGIIQVKSKLQEGSVFSVYLKKGISHFEPEQICKEEKDLPEIELPVPHSYKERSAMTSNPERKANPKEENSILVVDDNPEIIEFISYCLTPGYKIFTASNGLEGIDIAQKELPDIIISDVMMPEMDGFVFAEKIKKDSLTNHIPILFLTAKVSLEDTMTGLQMGASDYITKPFHEAILRTKIQNLIQDRIRLLERVKKEFGELDYTDQKKAMEKTLDPFLNKVITYIKENTENPDFTPEMIEEHCKVSKMQMYRKLKAVSGLSIVELIRDIKIGKATELLYQSDMTISEIGYHLGFSDPFYFSKTFKKKTGMSPLQYRKNRQLDSE